jgi:hypothetical protein
MGEPLPPRRELGGGLSIRLPSSAGRAVLGTTEAAAETTPLTPESRGPKDGGGGSPSAMLFDSFRRRNGRH